MSVRVQEADFDVSAEIAGLTDGDHGIGAVATFIGKVRGQAHGQALQAMTLEHYPGMTEGELERIEAEAKTRFNLSASLIVHRVGELQPGDNIVLVITCAPAPGRCLPGLRIPDGLPQDAGSVLEKRNGRRAARATGSTRASAMTPPLPAGRGSPAPYATCRRSRLTLP